MADAFPNRDEGIAQQSLANTPHRRVLGDVSPNIKAISATAAFLKKPPASSPLKRSYTASVEGIDGLRYLKKRKLSGEEALSQVDGGLESALRDEMGQLPAVGASFRPIFQPTNIQGVGYLFHFVRHLANREPSASYRSQKLLSLLQRSQTHLLTRAIIRKTHQRSANHSHP